jgi:hypothetical protein
MTYAQSSSNLPHVCVPVKRLMCLRIRRQYCFDVTRMVTSINVLRSLLAKRSLARSPQGIAYRWLQALKAASGDTLMLDNDTGTATRHSRRCRPQGQKPY